MRKLLAVVPVALILAGCGYSEAPKCGASEVKELALQLVDDQFNENLPQMMGTEAVAVFLGQTFDMRGIIADAYDEEGSRRECRAQVHGFPLRVENQNSYELETEQKRIATIEYKVTLTEDGNEIYVELIDIQ